MIEQLVKGITDQGQPAPVSIAVLQRVEVIADQGENDDAEFEGFLCATLSTDYDRSRCSATKQASSRRLLEERAQRRSLALANWNMQVMLQPSTAHLVVDGPYLDSVDATLAEIVERRDALREIKQAGIDCRLARATGYSCAEARQAGYPLLEAKAAGWSSDELRMAGYISSMGMSSREFFDRYQAGTTNFSGLDFSGEDFSRMVIDKACTFAGCDLTDATFDHATLCGIDFASSQVARVDMSHARLQRCSTFVGCVMSQSSMTRAGVSDSDFASTDLSNVDLSHAALHDCTFPNSSLHTARWASAKITGGAKTSKPFKALGSACSEARSLGLLAKQAGYSLEEIKHAGYSCAEAKQAGYVDGLKQAGTRALKVYEGRPNSATWPHPIDRLPHDRVQ